ncbi:hypothetical protein KSD_74370 [Ktedonobacter sp. SOSP1-85]|uniref:AAA family ATPase n=1 Tax=Ktedonobacter sp. SOSP1-85 TaxID=2778367 RepID=UPI0019150C42|nr:AAA family ATPase [Ktedonobacter sp. SOSP1-85]GHO79666.1 hypothetical protein KSD_74370 [Ktedonobacter sp. SOSP1-85]
MHPTFHISFLGDFLLMADDTPVTTSTIPHLQSLLVYLALHRNTPQSRSHLAFLLWPDSTEGQAYTNLRKLLYHLRQTFPDVDLLLSIGKQNIQWRPLQADVSWTLDVLEIEQALAQAEQARRAQNMSALREALEVVLRMYRGDLLPNCYDEWILPERDRLRQVFLQAAERLSALLEEERDYDAAITVAQQLLRQDVLREATYRQLMRLLALRGDRATALRIYHTGVTLLERELGVEPSQATRAVYEALLQSDSTPDSPTNSLTTRGTAVPLLGRKAEWRQIQEAWRKVTAGHQSFVILTGEAGIGKTRLAEEMEAWVSRQGMATASARCYALPGSLAYAPVTSWLRAAALQTGFTTLDSISLTEIARLVPEVLTTHARLSVPAAMTEGWQRQRFFAALARAVFSARQPFLLLLDDLQWCDNETLEWLHFLWHFDTGARFLLIGTVRAEEMVPGHPLATFLSTLQRDGLITEIPLGPLTAADTTILAEHMLGSQLDSAMSNTIYHETEGNPLFLVEMVRACTLTQQKTEQHLPGRPVPLLSQSASTLPPVVQSVLATRLAQLSPLAQKVANVAAVIGREFAFSVLVQASKHSEDEVVRGLDELWQRRIVREQGTGTAEAYDFSHDKLREQVYTSLSSASRCLLHRSVAEALKTLYIADQETVSGQIATHYEHANLPKQAIAAYQQAGKAALRIYAHVEAKRAFARAARLLETPGNIPWETAAQVYSLLGDVSMEVGSCEEARQAYQHAMNSIPPDAHLWRARLYWKRATTWMSISTERHDPSYLHGREEFEEAERILTQMTDTANLDWRDEWIALQFARLWQGKGSVDDMAIAIEKARPIVEQYGTQEQRKLLTQAVGVHNALRDRYVIPAERVATWRATIATMGPTENEAQRATDLAILAIGLVCAAQFDEAEELLWQALRLGERTGNAWAQNNCLTFLPFVFRQRGQVEQLRRVLTQARSIGIAPHNRILSGHAAWVAWREGNLALAETYGRESLQGERSLQIRPNPFLWTGRWPLIGVALAQEQTSAAINNVRLLFDPTQQPPREPLDTLLEAVLHAWDAGEEAMAHTLLLQARPLAEQMGYL